MAKQTCKSSQEENQFGLSAWKYEYIPRLKARQDCFAFQRQTDSSDAFIRYTHTLNLWTRTMAPLHTHNGVFEACWEGVSVCCLCSDGLGQPCAEPGLSLHTHTHHRDRTTTAMEEYSDISPSIILRKWENDAKEISSSYINMTVVEVFWIHLGLYFRTIAIYCISKALVKNGVLDTMPWFWYITYSTHILASWNSTLSM